MGRGRTALVAWPDLFIATIIKRTKKKRVVEIIWRMVQGSLARAEELLTRSRGGTVLNTAFIERLNATFRERLATLTRRCRHAAHRLEALETGMYLIGCVYNCCVAHDEVSSSKHFASPTTPAMAAGLTQHVWSVKEVLTFQMPPVPGIEATCRHLGSAGLRGRPSAHPPRLRPLVRLRKGVLCAVTD